MKLNVAQELKQPGRIGRCHEDVILDRQEYLGRELKFAAPLTVEGEYFFDGEGFSFKGTATTKLDSECALCGKPFIEELTFDFDERFLREPEPDSECYGYTGEELDVSQMLLDDLFLNLPAFSKCSEDCKGLCPVALANRVEKLLASPKPTCCAISVTLWSVRTSSSFACVIRKLTR